jgi:Anti-sigma-K factor rskA
VSHTDPMILALRALGEAAGTSTDAEHAQTCAHCRRELARLTEVVDLARDGGPVESLEQPPPAVWDRIAAAVATGPAVSSTAGNMSAVNSTAGNKSAVNGTFAANGTAALVAGELAGGELAGGARLEPVSAGNGDRGRTADSPPGTAHRGRRSIRTRGRLTTALAGLAAGLIIGIGGTTGIVQVTRAPATRVVAQIELSPLPAFPQWQGTTGTAVMRATGSQQLMVVTLHAPQRSGFYEVWLLARNGVSMISLGDLNADQAGTFTLPPGVDLRDYSRIDISLQPFDGSTLHSKTSVVRGSLPAVALGTASSA